MFQPVRNITIANNIRSWMPKYSGSTLEPADVLVVVGLELVVVGALLGIDEAE